jgi:hypothetical protein
MHMQIYALEESNSKRLFIFFLIDMNRDFKYIFLKKSVHIFVEPKKLCGYSFIPIRPIHIFSKLLGSK